MKFYFDVSDFTEEQINDALVYCIMAGGNPKNGGISDLSDVLRWRDSYPLLLLNRFNDITLATYNFIEYNSEYTERLYI